MGTVTGVVTEAGANRRTAQVTGSRPTLWGSIRRFVLLLWWLATETTRICLRYRVTGLAAEVGFFALLSMPPLVLGMVGSVGFVGDLMGTQTVSDLRQRLRELALTFLTPDSVSTVILPTFDQVLGAGRADIVSIGFVLSLWSGSRVLNVYLDTVSIMYGLGGLRGIVRTRVLSFSLYCLSLLIGIIVIPLVLIGPTWLTNLLRGAGLVSLGDVVGSDWVYWPTVSFAAIAGITGLYHLATPIRSRLYRDVPGAVLALVIWVSASFVLRWSLNESVGGTSIYGPLATPIVLLIWLYFLAIAVLIGAALNAAIDERWPTPARVEARIRVRDRHTDRTADPCGCDVHDPGRPEDAEPAQVATLTPLLTHPTFAPAPGTPVPPFAPQTPPSGRPVPQQPGTVDTAPLRTVGPDPSRPVALVRTSEPTPTAGPLQAQELTPQAQLSPESPESQPLPMSQSASPGSDPWAPQPPREPDPGSGPSSGPGRDPGADVPRRRRRRH